MWGREGEDLPGCQRSGGKRPMGCMKRRDRIHWRRCKQNFPSVRQLAQRGILEGIATVTKGSPKRSEETGKDGKCRKGWKGKWFRKVERFSENAGRRTA
jgi:hypothetical protein